MRKRIASFIISLSITFGLFTKAGESSWMIQNPRSFLWLPLFIYLHHETSFVLTNRKKRLSIFSAIPAFIISLCHLFGYVVHEKGTLFWLLKNINTAEIGLLHLFAWFLLFYIIIFRLFFSFQNAKIQEYPSDFRRKFIIFWIILAIAWLPWVLNQYPAVMTADTTDQIEMVLGIEQMTDHHPVFHTLLIKTALNLGKIFSGTNNSLQPGIILFTTTQFLVMTAAFAIVLCYIYHSNTYKIIKIGTFLFFLLYPVHPIYSITMWKDVPFSITLMILILLFTKLLQKRKQNNIIIFILISATGLILSLLRHNGIFILLLSIPFIPAFYKSQRKYLFIAFSITILLYFAWIHIILPSHNIPEGEASEAFSIPLQQISLTAKRHHEKMNSVLLSEIGLYFSQPNIWSFYNSRLSDPVKNLFSEEQYKKDPALFWKLWFKLGITYPQDYIDAFLIHTYGYWYPETPHHVFITGIDDNGLFGIHMDPKLNCHWMKSIVQWVSESKYDNFPLLSLFFSPGACFWIYLISFSYCLYRKHSAYFLFIPVFVLWMTAIASPVNCEYRYVYGMFVCWPIIITALCDKKTSA